MEFSLSDIKIERPDDLEEEEENKMVADIVSKGILSNLISKNTLNYSVKQPAPAIELT